MSWVRSVVLALIFALVGAFAASLWLELRQEAAPVEGPPPGRWEGKRIRVEVINGAGVHQLAARAKERLRDLDFDVVFYGNAPSFDRDSSHVIARLDAIEPARRVADALGIKQVVHKPDRNLFLDVTVILGSDWAEGPGDLKGGEGEEATGTWWGRIKRAALRLWLD